jgi:hypothetical protein
MSGYGMAAFGRDEIKRDSFSSCGDAEAVGQVIRASRFAILAAMQILPSGIHSAILRLEGRL